MLLYWVYTLKHQIYVIHINFHIAETYVSCRRNAVKCFLQVADATEVLLKDPRVAEVRDVRLRISTLRRRGRVVYLPAYVVDYTFGSRFNQHGERTPERFQAVISGMGELLYRAVLCHAVVCVCCGTLCHAVQCCAVLCCAALCCSVLSWPEPYWLAVLSCQAPTMLCQLPANTETNFMTLNLYSVYRAMAAGTWRCAIVSRLVQIHQHSPHYGSIVWLALSAPTTTGMHSKHNTLCSFRLNGPSWQNRHEVIPRMFGWMDRWWGGRMDE